MRKLNFASGPATLPEVVLRRAQEAIWDLDGSGIGLLEHSHRGKEFTRVIEGAEAAVREVGNIGSEYAVLFVTAGATQHFAMVPQNFLGAGQVADYCHTGVWSQKAIEEARRVGTANIACTSEPAFSTLPTQFTWTPGARYTHYTSNETIYGTEWVTPPPSPAPLVCDASSDIFSRPLPLANHVLIFAGAQKNLGPSGISLVIADKKFIETGEKNLSPLARYSVYAAEKSLHNTPNTFGIWMIGEVCKWILAEGGLAEMGERNARKAKLLYDTLDASSAWRTHAQAGSRSNMNVTWRGPSPAKEDQLIAEAEKRGLSGLRGHRSVGGMRASIYNAFPEDGVRQLCDLLREYDS